MISNKLNYILSGTSKYILSGTSVILGSIGIYYAYKKRIFSSVSKYIKLRYFNNPSNVENIKMSEYGKDRYLIEWKIGGKEYSIVTKILKGPSNRTSEENGLKSICSKSD